METKKKSVTYTPENTAVIQEARKTNKHQNRDLWTNREGKTQEERREQRRKSRRKEKACKAVFNGFNRP